METNVKPSSTDTAIKAIGFIFGTAHLLFQTAADLTCEAEGRLVEKVSKGAITKEQAKTNRVNETTIKQNKMLEALNKHKAKPQVQPQTV